MPRRTVLPVPALFALAGAGAGVAYTVADDEPQPRVVSVIPQKPLNGIPQEPIRVWDLQGVDAEEFFRTVHGTDREYETFTLTSERKWPRLGGPEEEPPSR